MTSATTAGFTMWKWIPKKTLEPDHHMTSERKSSPAEKSHVIGVPVWMNHLPTPEEVPPGINSLVTHAPGTGAGFRKNTFGTYFDTGTYF